MVSCLLSGVLSQSQVLCGIVYSLATVKIVEIKCFQYYCLNSLYTYGVQLIHYYLAA